MEMTYKDLSELAVEVERAGDLSYAATLWFKAAEIARQPINQNWATTRGEFCERWHPRTKRKKQTEEKQNG
ncbi:ANR family transcriptional regulator [Aggregatibacter aphrophilus]|uniref:ANR family transcriptional regulator n=1 Tax=Aggregatibacter aphrophilus TaxID=732 RepID=UPI000D64B461|nr:ANR family transcriptional regulator [Aggregatibacter aphrophilus]